MTEEQYIIKGFNDGYLIAKHKPELSQILQKGLIDKKDPYINGFIAGSKEFEQEKFKSRGKNYNVPPTTKFSKNPTRNKDHNKDSRDR